MMKGVARAWMLVLLPLGGCALTSKATPLDIRYFSPERVDASHAAREAQAPASRLHLGPLTSSANLRQRIVHRESPVELDEYEALRWTENPEDYVRRSLSRSLFAAGGLEEVVGGAAPALDVEVVLFEEARREGRHVGRVQLGYQLHDERVVLGSGVVTAERDVAGDGIEPVIVAIGSAMDAATSELATKVAAQLRGH